MPAQASAGKKIYLETILNGRDEFFRSISMHQALTHSYFFEDDTRTIYMSGVDYAPWNGVIDKSGELKESELDDIIHQFRNAKLPFIWWGGSKLLEKKGLHFAGHFKGICLDLNRPINALQPMSVPVEIKSATTLQELIDFTSVLATNLALEPDAAKQLMQVLLLAQQKGSLRNIIAYINGVPAATITLFSGTIAGVWNLSTLPAYRNQGIGMALTHAAIKEARQQGYEHMMSVLMSQGIAWNLCAELGCGEVCDLPFYTDSKEGVIT